MRGLAIALAMVLLIGTAGAAANDAKARCVRLENRITDLRLKLRMGYTAQQGRQYRQKLAALEAERRVSCR